MAFRISWKIHFNFRDISDSIFSKPYYTDSTPIVIVQPVQQFIKYKLSNFQINQFGQEVNRDAMVNRYILWHLESQGKSVLTLGTYPILIFQNYTDSKF